MTIPLIQKLIFTYIFCLWLIYTFFPFKSFILHYFYLLWQSILHSMKNENQPQVQYTVIYLQLTSTFTVRFGAVPIPLYAVQRYFPLLFLLVSRTNWFPVPSATLSLPWAYTLVQVMVGVGSPSAIHSKVILGSPSTTTASLLTLLNSGGSVKELKTKSNFAHYPRYTPIWHLGHLQQQLHLFWLNWTLVDLFRSDNNIFYLNTVGFKANMAYEAV